jgi:hypothetical protein
MDPNIIGMHRRIPAAPQRQIHTIVALALSPESHGNAHGIGMADIIPQHLRDQIDWHASYTNAITAGFLAGVRMPLTCASPAEAIALAVRPFPPEQARIVRIPSTAHLEDLWISAALLAELPQYPHLQQITALRPITFS